MYGNTREAVVSLEEQINFLLHSFPTSEVISGHSILLQEIISDFHEDWKSTNSSHHLDKLKDLSEQLEIIITDLNMRINAIRALSVEHTNEIPNTKTEKQLAY